MNPEEGEREVRPALRDIADRAFSRAAGAPLIGGNRIRLLKDASENYPAWLQAINGAKRQVCFESYLIRDDEIGREFANALIAKARDGVPVRLAYDWFGALGNAGRQFWAEMRTGGVEVRCYNPPRPDSPFGWPSRDHRKMLAVDGEVAFITGLCVGKMWAGDPQTEIEPWRDTGVEIRGPAVADAERAFAQIWALMGKPIPEDEQGANRDLTPVGDVSVRIVATLPSTAGMFRFDQLVTALARRRLWITDAYYAGTTVYVQALRAAARDGVDVRLLVPSGTDIPILRPLSRAGYRSLLEAGVRVFEWNGPMIHAKTAVADGQWARVGSTNLNIASWLSNCELDVVIENEPFAGEMEEMYLQDLANATEVVLDAKQRIRRPGEPRRPVASVASGSGSAGRAVAGAVRIGNTIGAAFTNRRLLGAVEARITMIAGGLLLALSILFAFFPRALAYPLIGLSAWFALVLLFRSYKLYAQRRARSQR
jgi:cardiolipin synthase A/B